MSKTSVFYLLTHSPLKLSITCFILWHLIYTHGLLVNNLYKNFSISSSYFTTLFFYKCADKPGWSSISLRFCQFEPEIMLDAILNFKTHFMVWYCVWYESCKTTPAFLVFGHYPKCWSSPLHRWSCLFQWNMGTGKSVVIGKVE